MAYCFESLDLYFRLWGSTASARCICRYGCQRFRLQSASHPMACLWPRWFSWSLLRSSIFIRVLLCSFRLSSLSFTSLDAWSTISSLIHFWILSCYQKLSASLYFISLTLLLLWLLNQPSFPLSVLSDCHLLGHRYHFLRTLGVPDASDFWSSIFWALA